MCIRYVIIRTGSAATVIHRSGRWVFSSFQVEKVAEGDENKRMAQRQPVLKSAKIHFAHSVVDCLVLDSSPGGIRLSTELPIAFPDEVKVEMRSGAIWRAGRRWQRGVEAGFELLQFAGLSLECSVRASALYTALRASPSTEITERLAHEGYFESPALREAALALASAHTRLEDALRAVLDAC